MKSLFITFEGPEGAGKTTVIEKIAERLKLENYALLQTREPGGIKIAEEIREVILNPANTEMDEHTEALLYAAARSQHYFEKVKPALEKGKIVLCDRFIDSSLAYQGYARGLGMAEVLAINEFAIGKQMPDVTILFDLAPEVGLARIHSNDEREKNRLDNESLTFHKKVREAYLQLYEKNRARIYKVDASRSVAQVTEDVWCILADKLNKSE